MSFGFDISKNSLLVTVARLLGGADISMKTVNNLLEESTPEQLIPCFAFLIYWLTTHIDRSSGVSFLTSQQAAYYLVSKIVTNVPPVVLLTGINQINWGFCHPEWILTDMYAAFNHSINILRTYFRAYYCGNLVSMLRPLYHVEESLCVKDIPKLMTDLQFDLEYHQACEDRFRKMILLRAPVSSFENFLEKRNAKILLTRTLISIINKLNGSRTATHSQLLHSFSVVFLYIQSFAMSKNIDCQYLCNYIMSMPFHSPFLLLAMVNHIPSHFFLYYLLTPRELGEAETLEEAQEIINKCYTIVDFSTDTEYDELTRLMPRILLIYFKNIPLENEKFRVDISDIDLIIKLQMTGNSVYDRMKAFISISGSRKFDQIVFSGASSQLLNCITQSFQRTFVECLNAGMFTPNLSYFFGKVLGTVLPTLGPKIFMKYDEMIDNDPSTIEYVIRSALAYNLPALFDHIETNNTIPICLRTKFDTDINQYSRLLIVKFLRMGPPILMPKIIEELEKCDDTVVQLEYICSIDEEQAVNRSDEYNGIMSVRNTLLKKLPFTMTGNPLMITGVNSQTGQLSLISNKITQMLSNIFCNPTPTELVNQLRLAGTNGNLLLRLVCSTVLIKNNDIATAAADFTIEMLTSKTDTLVSSEAFNITTPMFYLPVAQYLLGQLLRNKYENLSCKLIHNMSSVLLADSTKVHWLSKFLPAMYDFLTPRVKAEFAAVYEQLPMKDLISKDENRVEKLTRILAENEMNLIIDPKKLDSEFASMSKQAILYGICSFIIFDNGRKLVDEFLDPILVVFKIWPNRMLCIKLSTRIVAFFPSSICWEYFNRLYQMPLSDLSYCAMLEFLNYAPLDVYTRIATSSKTLINDDPELQIRYQKLIMPTFRRLYGNSEAATKMICGMLESIGSNPTEELQETTIDTVLCIYFTLNLRKARAALINSSYKFMPSLRAIIASSLDLKIENVKNYLPATLSEMSKINRNANTEGMFVWK